MEKILKVLGGVRPYSTTFRTKGGRADALTSRREEVGKTASVRRWLYG